MTEATITLEPAAPAAPIPPVVELAATPAVPTAVEPFTFLVKDFGQNVTMDLARLPDTVVDYLLKNAIKAYVQNRTSTAKSSAKDENAPWTAYENAVAANGPDQTLVPLPEKPKVIVDYADIIKKAVKALYDDTIGKRDGSGTKKKAERKDPLISAITRTVIQEVFEKNYALDNNYKFPMASKEVGTDGLAYLRAKMAANVAAGVATQEQMDYVLETKYLKPARIMLGLDPLTGKGKDMPDILG